jgi:biotin carboxyl carrier protein
MKVIVNDKAYSVEAQGETVQRHHALLTETAGVMALQVTVEGRPFKVRVEGGQPLATVTVDGRTYKVEAQRSGEAYAVLVDGKAYRVAVEGAVSPAPIARPGTVAAPRPAAPAPAARAAPAPAEAAAPGAVTALMPGRVVAVRVQESDAVEAGQVLLILEAMKMENEIRAPKAGVVKSMPVSVGSNVNKGDVLAVVE